MQMKHITLEGKQSMFNFIFNIKLDFGINFWHFYKAKRNVNLFFSLQNELLASRANEEKFFESHQERSFSWQGIAFKSGLGVPSLVLPLFLVMEQCHSFHFSSPKHSRY